MTSADLFAWASNPIAQAFAAGFISGALFYRRMVRWTLGGRA